MNNSETPRAWSQNHDLGLYIALNNKLPQNPSYTKKVHRGWESFCGENDELHRLTWFYNHQNKNIIVYLEHLRGFRMTGTSPERILVILWILTYGWWWIWIWLYVLIGFYGNRCKPSPITRPMLITLTFLCYLRNHWGHLGDWLRSDFHDAS